MGFFGNNIKKYLPILPIVQPSLAPEDYNRLSEKYIKNAISVYLSSSEKILNDCVRIVNSTDNIETFISRHETLLNIVSDWAEISKFYNDCFKGGNPQKDLESIMIKTTATQREAIDRYLAKEEKAIFLLSTQKSKQTRYDKAIKLLIWHIEKFSEENKTYIYHLYERQF